MTFHMYSIQKKFFPPEQIYFLIPFSVNVSISILVVSFMRVSVTCSQAHNQVIENRYVSTGRMTPQCA